MADPQQPRSLRSFAAPRLPDTVRAFVHQPEETTLLTPAEELAFRRWAIDQQIRDVDHPESHYDYRGYWKDIARQGGDARKDYPDGPHFPDTYKQHGHPTFSVESKYSRGPSDGGMWIGEEYLAQRPYGTPVAHPPPTMRAQTLSERASERIRDVYEAAAAQPVGQMLDLSGIVNLGGMARQYTEGAVPSMAMMPDLPGVKSLTAFADPHLAVAPVERVNGRLFLSTRVPSAKNAPSATGGPLMTTVEDVARDPALQKKIADRLRTDPILRPSETRLSDRGVLDAFVNRAGENIDALLSMQPAAIRTRAARWYQGGHQIADDFAREVGVTGDQGAAVLASQSPSKEWHQNVDLARRIMRRWKDWGATDPAFSPELADHYARTTLQSTEELIKANHLTGAEAATARARAAQKIEATRQFAGRRWSELPVDQQARMLRAADELADPAQAYPVWSPEGTIASPVAVTKDGAPKKLVWQSYYNIENGLSVLHNGSDANISQRVGMGHKVRSFFNNLNVPLDPRSVTVDTHNVGGAHFRPMGGNAPEVKFVMGGPGSAPTGISGAHAVYRDAVAQAAAGHGLLPNQAQSVSWESIKGLFSPSQRRDPAFVDQVRSLWQEYLAVKYA